MDAAFFTQKIQQLSNDKLRQLLTFRTKANAEIMELAEKEAIRRGIDPEAICTEESRDQGELSNVKKDDDSFWKNILIALLS